MLICLAHLIKLLLLYVNKNKILLQLSASTVSCEQRDFVVRELLDTEANYLEVLKALKYKFMGPLEKLLSQEELTTIFYCIKVIY